MAFITQQPSGKARFDEVADGGKALTVGRSTRLVGGEERGELEALVFGVTQTSQSTLLLKKRKEMREVDEALEFMKDEFKARMEACDERQRDFESKQREMKEQVSRFEKFVQENDAKRARAEQKAKLESKMRVQQEEKLNGLRDRFAEMQEERKVLQDELDQLKRYQWYLESSVEASEGEYEEIPDILNRFKTLSDANLDLKRLVAEGEHEMDRIRGELTQLRHETQNALLVHNSEIHTHQKNLEGMREHAMKADNERELGERFTKDRHRETGQVVMSIKNLYLRCVNTSRSKTRPAPLAKNATQSQQLSEFLRIIQFRITDLQTIADHFQTGGAVDALDAEPTSPQSS